MIKIVSFIDSYKHYEAPIKEFEKRLWKKIEFIKLKPSKKKNISEIILEETEILKEKLQKLKWFKVLLSINWKNMNSLDFSQFIEEKQMNFSDIIFIIWWAYWLDEKKIKDFVDFYFSFSAMTFPHIQAILMLFEQIYRAETIKNGSSYHH